MLKKLVYIASVLVFAGSMTASAEGLTPLQRKVREAFASIRNSKNIETPVVVEEKQEAADYDESNVTVEAMAAQDANANIILADDQDDDTVTVDGEDDEFVVIHAPKQNDAVCEAKCEPKAEVKQEVAVKTAAEASSKQRTAKINKKWNIEALGWNNKLTGHVKIAENENNPESGEKINLGDDTKDLDKKTVPGIKIAYNANKRSSVSFSWVKIDQDGKLGLNRKFKGVEYKKDANFEINNSMYDLSWNYRLAHKVAENGREKNYVSAILGVKASDMEFKLSGEDNAGNAVSEDYSKTLPVPYIGLEFGSDVCDDLYFKASIRYLKLDGIKDYDVKHCDYDVALSYKVNSQKINQDLFIDVGYRQTVFDVDGEGNDVKLKYKGPYVGVEYLF